MKITFRKQSAFTLLELLVTLFIIAVIISLSVIVYDMAWSKSRDSKRTSDIIKIQNALEKYHQQEGKYPDSLSFGSPLIGLNTSSPVTYMETIPSNPSPRTDGNCTTSSEYQYSTTSDLYGNEGFGISFCLGNKIDQISQGDNCATENGIVAGVCNSYNLKEGQMLWLRADAGVVKDENNLVSSWTDESGNHNNATASGRSRPLFVANQANGLPVIRFDGVDDFMSFNEISTMRTIFLVVKHDSGKSAGYEIILGHHTLYNFCGDIGTNLFASNNISTYIKNGQDFVNGIATAPDSMAKPANYSIISLVTTGNVTAEYITNDGNYPGRYWNGDYAEILIYDKALSETGRQTAEEYLMEKYGI